jgi:hypothetical protein
MEKNREGVIIQGLDVLDVISLVSNKGKRFLASGLDDIERIQGLTPDQFKLIRKIFLDTINDLIRSILRVLFGDVEIEQYKK